jgi:hypothetical protein
MSSSDPLGLAELSVDALQPKIDAKNAKTKPSSELEMQKEARLAEKEKRLTMKTAAKAAPPEAPPPAPPPQQDRSVLLDKIGAYRERFPFLKKRNNVTAKSTIEEISDELHYCELQLGSQNTSHQLSSTVLYGTMAGIETLTRDYWNPLGLNLNGLGMVTQQNMDQFQPILDELMIKHNAGTYTSPEWRLALAMGATVLTVNAANSNPEMAQAVKAMNQAVTPPPGGKDL